MLSLTIRKAAAATLAAVALQFIAATAPAAAAAPATPGEIIVDVLSDARTVVINHRDPAQATPDPTDAENFGRGDTFILEGVIYPAGTLSPGEDGRVPEQIPGAIGKWVCRGTMNVSAAEAFGQGLFPHVYATEFFFFDDGATYVTEGPEGGAPMLRAVIGGMGPAAGASGQQLSTEIGVNPTGLQNFRMQLSLDPPFARLARIEEALDGNANDLAGLHGLLMRVARALSLRP